MTTRKKVKRFNAKEYLDRRAESSLRSHAKKQLTRDELTEINQRLEKRVANWILNHKKQNSAKLIGYLRQRVWLNVKRFKIGIVLPNK